MSGVDFKKRLKAMKKNFKECQKDYSDPFSGDVPAGIYNFKMTRFDLNETSNDSLAVFREQVILEGEHKGDKVFDMFAIENDFGMKNLLRFLDQLGHEVESLEVEEIEDICAEVMKDEPEYKARLKYSKKGGFSNLTVMEVYESEGAEDDEEEEDEVDYSEMSLKELKAECKEEGIDIPKKATKEDLLELLQPEDEEDEDAEEEEEADEEEDDSDEDEENPLTDKLIEFAVCRDLEVQEDDDYETVIEVLKEYEFNKSELEDDEYDLLVDAGLGDLIQDDKPKKKKKEKAVKEEPKKIKSKKSRLRK